MFYIYYVHSLQFNLILHKLRITKKTLFYMTVVDIQNKSNKISPKDICICQPCRNLPQIRDGRFGYKVGQIGPKWDKSGLF